MEPYQPYKARAYPSEFASVVIGLTFALLGPLVAAWLAFRGTHGSLDLAWAVGVAVFGTAAVVLGALWWAVAAEAPQDPYAHERRDDTHAVSRGGTHASPPAHGTTEHPTG